VDVVDVAGGAAWPIPMGFWNVPFGCVLTGAPERVLEEVDPMEDPVPEPVPVPVPVAEPEPEPPPPLAKAESDAQETTAMINNVSFLEAMVRSIFHR
jgi:hypothetical protein